MITAIPHSRVWPAEGSWREVRGERGTHCGPCRDAQGLLQPEVCSAHSTGRTELCGLGTLIERGVKPGAGKCLCPQQPHSRTHTGALAPVSAPTGKAVCSWPDKPLWPVCPVQGAERGNERGDRLIKEEEDMALLCLPREAPVQHSAAPAQNCDAAHPLTACCLLEAQLVADSKPRGSLPFGSEKLQFVSCQILQECRSAVQAAALPAQLSDPWGVSLPRVCCRGIGAHKEMHNHRHQCFGKCCFSDTLAHWRALETLVCSPVWGFGQLYPVSGVTVIKKQNLTLSLVGTQANAQPQCQRAVWGELAEGNANSLSVRTTVARMLTLLKCRIISGPFV